MLANHAKRAFTLIELLVVIAIIGILAGVVIFGTSGAIKKAKESVALSGLTQVERAVKTYLALDGDWGVWGYMTCTDSKGTYEETVSTPLQNRCHRDEYVDHWGGAGLASAEQRDVKNVIKTVTDGFMSKLDRSSDGESETYVVFFTNAAKQRGFSMRMSAGKFACVDSTGTKTVNGTGQIPTDGSSYTCPI